MQKLRMWSLEAPGRVTEERFGITNEIFTNLVTDQDMERMAVLLAARSTASAAASTNGPVDMGKLLKDLLRAGATKGQE
jgi:hypothetical protein